MLGEIISCESEKTDDDADFELIEECEELLCELIGDEVKLSDKEIQNRIDKITHQQRGKIIFNRNHPKKLSHAFAIFCTIIAFCISVGAVCVINPAIRDGIRAVLKLNIDESIDINGVTFINNGIESKYSSIDELLEDNAINIMYPHELPENVKIDSIYTMEDKLFPISILFSDYHLSVTIYYNNNDKIENLKKMLKLFILMEKHFCDKNTRPIYSFAI